MDLLEDKDNIVSRLQRGFFSPVPIKVNFPVQNPLPSLLLLKVNGEVICSQNPGETKAGLCNHADLFQNCDLYTFAGAVIGPYTQLNLIYTLKNSVTFFPPYPGVPRPLPPTYPKPESFVLLPSTSAPQPITSSPRTSRPPVSTWTTTRFPRTTKKGTKTKS